MIRTLALLSTRLPRHDNLSVRRAKQKANLMYKCVNKLAPVYLCNMFTPRTLSFDLRDTRQKLCLPKPSTDYLKRNLSYSGASLWNGLLELGSSLYKISRHLQKKHLLINGSLHLHRRLFSLHLLALAFLVKTALCGRTLIVITLSKQL